MEPKQIDESLRKLVKARVSALAVQCFGNEISYLVPEQNKRGILYDELALKYNDDENAFDEKVKNAIFVFMQHSFAIAYETSKIWSAHFLRSYNVSVSPAQIMRAYKNKETHIYSEHTTEEQVVESLKNIGIEVYTLEKAKEEFVLPESGLNDNFSDPKHSTSVPYDVIGNPPPEDNRNYAML